MEGAGGDVDGFFPNGYYAYGVDGYGGIGVPEGYPPYYPDMMYGVEEAAPATTRRRKQSKSRKRSKSKGKKSRYSVEPPQPAGPLVPDKDAYKRFLSEVAEWNFVKQRNLLVNVFHMLGREEKKEVRQILTQVEFPEYKRLPVPPMNSTYDFCCHVTVLSDGRKDSKLAQGSYIFACRRDWGMLAVYRKPRQAQSQSFLSHGLSKSLPTWDDLLKMEPTASLLFLELSRKIDDSEPLTIKLSAYKQNRKLTLLFGKRDYGLALSAIRMCHQHCRPFGSHEAYAEFYIDGENYFPNMAEAMLAARKSILIADWWMSPFVFLKREMDRPLDMNYRFDNLLQRKAFEGVSINILLWQELEQALTLTSANTVKYLESLHPTNIKVIRHRDIQDVKFTHHQKFVVVDWTVVFIGGLDICYGRYDTQSHPLFDPEGKQFIGLDYRNPMLVADSNAQVKAPFQDTLNRQAGEPRMPWHDVNIMLKGKIAYNVGLNFVQRWNHHRGKLHAPLSPDVEALYNDVLQMHSTGKVMTRLSRSMADWAGNPENETDIQKQYLKLIAQAKHFIYIENQYFISSVYGSDVSNKIAQALIDRIEEAYTNKRVFRVLLLIQPHGEGDPIKDPFIQRILWFQNQTLIKMVNKVTQKLGSPEVAAQYLQIGCLQKWEKGRHSKHIFSTIYIHSKLMVVDDCRLIVGSANINDRSFLGDRDSEIAAVVDEALVPSSVVTGTINGVPVEVGRQIRDFRLRLWEEHLGESRESSPITDPTCDETWHLIQERMASNSALFAKAFPSVPSNDVTTLEEALKLASKEPQDVECLKKVKGHIVKYPLKWLSQVGSTTSLAAQAAGVTLFV